MGGAEIGAIEDLPSELQATVHIEIAKQRASNPRAALRQKKQQVQAAVRHERDLNRIKQQKLSDECYNLTRAIKHSIAEHLAEIAQADRWSADGILFNYGWRRGFHRTIIVKVGAVCDWNNDRDRTVADVCLNPRGKIYLRWWIDLDDCYGTYGGTSPCRPLHRLSHRQLKILARAIKAS